MRKVWLLLGLVTLLGCSVRHMALGTAGEMLREGSAAMNGEPDYEIARQAFPGNLKTMEVLLESDPDNPDFLFLLAQGYAAYTYLFVEDELDLADAAGDAARARELKERGAGLYRRAQAYGAQLLGAEFAAAVETGDMEQARRAVEGLDKPAVPALFWYSFAWAGRVNLDQSNPERIAELPRIELLIGRAVELGPDYYFGLPLLTAGGVYAGRAPMFGGDLAKGKALFAAGIAVSQGKFLLGRFLLARFYAVQAQDSALFCSLLQEVAAAPADLLPEQQMMNNISQRWAARWLARADTLFADLDAGCTAPALPQEEKMEEDDELLQ